MLPRHWVVVAVFLLSVSITEIGQNCFKALQGIMLAQFDCFSLNSFIAFISFGDIVL